MRHWFVTSAVVAISTLTVSLTISFILFYLILRSTLRALFVRIYPEAKKLSGIKGGLTSKKLQNLNLASEQTDDLFTSGSDNDDDRPVNLYRKTSQSNEKQKSLPERILLFIF